MKKNGSWLKLYLSGGFLLVLFLSPIFIGVYGAYILNIIAISVILSVGLNLLMGYTGQISLGHAGFFAVGAYSSAIFTTRLGIPFIISLPLGGIVAIFFSLFIGFAVLRMRGLYLALSTFGFGLIIQLMAVHWTNLTGGSRGYKVPRPSIGPLIFGNDNLYLYFTLVVAVVLVIFAHNLVSTRIGRVFISIRDSEFASQSVGINLAKYKLIAFALSSFYAGIAGGLFGPLVGLLDPEGFGLGESVLYLMMIVIGGIGSIAGSVIGAIVLVMIPEILRFVREYRDIIYSLTLLLFLIYMQEGIYPLLRKLLAKLLENDGGRI